MVDIYSKQSNKNRQLFSDLKSLPIVIGGCARSGTTILLSILSAHPHIYAIHEEQWAFLPTLSIKDFRTQYDNFCAAWSKVNVGRESRRWAEKTPKNVTIFGQFIEAGIECRMIHIIRDGRDVVTSKHHSRDCGFFVSPEQWVNDVSAGLRWLDHPDVLTLRYENLVNNFESTIGEILNFLNEPLCPEILEWHKHTTIIKHSSWGWGKVRPLFADSVGRWNRHGMESRVNEFMENENARTLLRALGYDGNSQNIDKLKIPEICKTQLDYRKSFWFEVRIFDADEKQ